MKGSSKNQEGNKKFLVINEVKAQHNKIYGT